MQELLKFKMHFGTSRTYVMVHRTGLDAGGGRRSRRLGFDFKFGGRHDQWTLAS